MKRALPILLLILIFLPLAAQKPHYTKFRPGALWFDTDKRVINAHGGCGLFHEGRYYWFGEHRDEFTTETLVGLLLIGRFAQLEERGYSASCKRNAQYLYLYGRYPAPLQPHRQPLCMAAGSFQIWHIGSLMAI